MSIIISKSGKKALKIEETGVESEDYLQRYICHNLKSFSIPDNYIDQYYTIPIDVWSEESTQFLEILNSVLFNGEE